MRETDFEMVRLFSVHECSMECVKLFTYLGEKKARRFKYYNKILVFAIYQFCNWITINLLWIFNRSIINFFVLAQCIWAQCKKKTIFTRIHRNSQVDNRILSTRNELVINSFGMQIIHKRNALWWLDTLARGGRGEMK